jgi:hypothetical protein
MNLPNYLAARFIALYVLLGVIVSCSVSGAIVLAMQPGVNNHINKVEASLGDQNLGRLANKFIIAEAANAGFSASKIKIHKVVKNNNEAKVYADVTLSDGSQTKRVTLVVHFVRGVWNATSLGKT